VVVIVCRSDADGGGERQSESIISSKPSDKLVVGDGLDLSQSF
jgi:hypothetical protein